MPRIIKDYQQRRAPNHELVAELATELRANRTHGQPIIHEQRFPRTHAVRTTVIWDRWEELSDEERVATILDAYEEVEGSVFRGHLALVIGLTAPEAYESGLLPVQISAALRKTDPVTAEECRDVMVRQGASVLNNPDRPELRFATVEEADQCVQRLVDELPESKSVWVVNQEVARIVD